MSAHRRTMGTNGSTTSRTSRRTVLAGIVAALIVLAAVLALSRDRWNSQLPAPAKTADVVARADADTDSSASIDRPEPSAGRRPGTDVVVAEPAVDSQPSTIAAQAIDGELSILVFRSPARMPAANATVEVREYPDDAPPRTERLVTGAEGVVRRARVATTASVCAWTRDEAGGRPTLVDETSSVVEIELLPVAVVEGVVLESVTHAPIPGATVHCPTFRSDLTAITDASGRFTLACFPSDGIGRMLRARGLEHGVASLMLRVLPDSSWEILPLGRGRSGASSGAGPASAPGASDAEPASSANGPSSPARVEFVLVPSRRVRGRVLDADGVPAGGARVTARAYFWSANGVASPDEASTTAAPDGSFELADLRSDLAHRIEVEFGPARQRVARVPDDCGALCDLGTFRLERAATVRGVVVTADGRGVAAVQVTLARQSTASESLPPSSPNAAPYVDALEWIVVTDADGAFESTGMQSGSYELRVEAGWKRIAKQSCVVEPGVVAETARIELAADTWCLRGVVVDGARPLPDVEVVLEGAGERTTRTALDGTFAFGALDPLGEHRIVVSRGVANESGVHAAVSVGPRQEHVRVDVAAPR